MQQATWHFIILAILTHVLDNECWRWFRYRIWYSDIDFGLN